MSAKRRRSILAILDDYFEDFEVEFEGWRESLVERPSWNQRNCTIEPLRNMEVTAAEVIVTVDLPFTKEDTVRVKPIDKRTLEISASMKRKIRFAELGITHHKGEFHKLYCHSRVPVPVQMDKMEMRLKKGMLQIRLPRKT